MVIFCIQKSFMGFVALHGEVSIYIWFAVTPFVYLLARVSLLFRDLYKLYILLPRSRYSETSHFSSGFCLISIDPLHALRVLAVPKGDIVAPAYARLIRLRPVK